MEITKAPRYAAAILRAHRISLGIGLRELARKLDMLPGNLSNVENGKIGASLEILAKIAAAMNCTIQCDVVLAEKFESCPTK